MSVCRCVIPQLPHMPTHSLAILAVSLAELQHSPPQEFSSYMLELFHQRAMAAAAAAMAAAAAGRTAATAAVGGSTGSSSSSRAGKGASLPSHAASFLWALPRLLLGHTGSNAAAAAPSRPQQQQHQAKQPPGKQARARQQQPQQQQELRVVSKSWMRQYCWLLQVRVA